MKYVDPTGMYYEATRTWAGTGWVFTVADGPALVGDAIYVGGLVVTAVGDTLYYFGDKIISGIDALIKNANTIKNGLETGSNGGKAKNNGSLSNNSNNNNHQRGVGGKGWRGDRAWKANVKQVSEGGTIRDFNGKVPTQQEAIDLIKESGGTITRIEGPHAAPNPHTFDHINYTTAME